MKKMMLMAAVLVTAACGEKQADAPAIDTSAVAPMPVDTAMMQHDTTMIHDSGMVRDSATAGASH